MDIHWWMDAIGLLNDHYDEVENITRARRLPSLQLIGSPERRSLDLTTLSGAGVNLVGRFAGVVGSTDSSPVLSPTSAPQPTSSSADCSKRSMNTPRRTASTLSSASQPMTQHRCQRERDSVEAS
jgi:hypothetical protein